jgi:hypothetical protein
MEKKLSLPPEIREMTLRDSAILVAGLAVKDQKS